MFEDSPECSDQRRGFTAERILVGDKVKRAMHVLNALAVDRAADPSDVAELRRFAPMLANVPLKELAWGVLEQLLSEVGAERAVAASGRT